MTLGLDNVLEVPIELIGTQEVDTEATLIVDIVIILEIILEIDTRIILVVDIEVILGIDTEILIGIDTGMTLEIGIVELGHQMAVEVVLLIGIGLGSLI